MGGVSRHRLAALVETALIALGLAGMAFVLPHHISGDGAHRYLELVELFDGRLSADSYSMIMPLFALPFWLGGRAALAYFNLFVFALTLGTTYLLLRNRLDRTVLRRFLLLLTAGTMVVAHVTDFYGETFTASCVAVGILAALTRTGASMRAGWVAVVIGAANTPASLIGLGLVSAERTVTSRRLRYLGIVAAGAALVMAEAWLRRDGPFDSGHDRGMLPRTVLPYQGPTGFTYPFVLGIFAILLSFGKGLVYFMPGLLLPVRRRLADAEVGDSGTVFRAYVLWLLFLAGLVVAYASWWAWYGGFYWGPRFFLIGVFPASLALAAALSYRRASALADLATLAVLALSIWVAASGSVFHDALPWMCYQGDQEREALCLFVPELSQLWYPLIARPHLSVGQLAYLAYFAVVFGYLAAPVVVRLVGTLRTRFRSRVRGWTW